MNTGEDPASVTLPVIRASQPIGDFYIGKLDSKTLCDITEFDIRHLILEKQIESYLGIQRRLDQKRVDEEHAGAGIFRSGAAADLRVQS